MRRLVVPALVALAACGDDGSSVPIDAPIDGVAALCTPTAGTTVALAPPIATGLDQPVALAAAPGDRRIFIVEQAGAIRLIKNEALVTAPFLDLSGTAGPVRCCGEQGLLGLAFHPQFTSNGRFYVNYTRKPDGATVIAEYTAALGADTADATTAREVLVIPQPYANHNAGWLAFGPDGKLYIAMGDGGSGGDPENRAQNDRELLGKLLRIDVNTRTGTKAYGIPADNPHAASPDGATDPRPEIWGKGLRNPFRFAFDEGNGDLYIADVGQGLWEEVNAGPNVAGTNWGWRQREGMHCYLPNPGCETAGLTDPVVEHSHNNGWISSIGGHVYRGTCFPGLVGQYFYGDYGQAGLWSFTLSGSAAQNDREVIPAVGALTHIAADATGEVYVVTHDGRVRRIIAQ